MTDVLIRNVPEEDLMRIDEQAARLGLSRSEYLRRRILSEASRTGFTVERADLDRFAALSEDLVDDDVMRSAWT
jgi:hypothetical protein